MMKVKTDSHGYGRTCISCNDGSSDINCCRLSTYADDERGRVNDIKNATYIAKHGVMACKREKENPVLYKTDGIAFDSIEGIVENEQSCESVGIDDGTTGCERDSCSFSYKAILRDKMGDFTSKERRHVRCGIPDSSKRDKHVHEFDCCVKVTGDTSHPVYGCKIDKLATNARMLINGKWNESDDGICDALGRSLNSELQGVPAGMKRRVVPKRSGFKFTKNYSVGGNFIEWLSSVRKDLAYRVKNPPFYAPLRNALAMEPVPGKEGKGCGWTMTDKIHRRMD